MYSTLKKDLIVFFILSLIVIISVFICSTEYTLDLYNYEYYNVWAFLNNRYEQDFLAADFRTYWNPFIDFYQYFAINIFKNHKFLYTIASVLDDIIALFLVYKIADKFLSYNVQNRNLSLALIVLYVIFSPIMHIVVCDCSRNDMFITVIILLAFYLLLNIFNNTDSKKTTKYITITGALVGIAIGLKLTAAVFGLTFLLCLICLSKTFKNPLKNIFLFLLSMITAFLLVDGYWLYKIYSLFQNPFFPIFNNIFHSPYADSNDIYTIDYACIKPRGFIDFLLYPFMWGEFVPYGTLQRSWDSRYAINIICIFILTFAFLKKYYMPVKNRNWLYFLILFCFLSYEINLLVFGMYRYITATSLLFGLILFCTTYVIISKIKIFNKTRVTTVMLFMIALTLCTQVIFYYTVPKGRLFVEQKKVLKTAQNYNIEDDSTVLILSMATTAFITQQNKNAHYIHFAYPKMFAQWIYDKNHHHEYETDVLYFNCQYYFSDYLEEKMKEILQSNKKVYMYVKIPDYILYFDVINASIDYYSNGTRYIKNCSKFDSDTESRKHFYNAMCEIVKR